MKIRMFFSYFTTEWIGCFGILDVFLNGWWSSSKSKNFYKWPVFAEFEKFCHGLYIMQILYILVLSKKLFDKLRKIVMYAWCIEMGWVLLYYFFAYLHKSGPAWAWNVSCILSTTLQLQFESWYYCSNMIFQMLEEVDKLLFVFS